MQKMNYDCTAETSALRHAKTCSGELSERSSRPGLKENIIKLYKNYLNDTDVGLPYGGGNCLCMESMLKCDSPQKFAESSVKNMFKHFGPSGNRIGENIYGRGNTCAKCPGNSTCNDSTGLCN
ncbi:hypothetical protein OSTOST_12542 [Ostertagia ostertagi]